LIAPLRAERIAAHHAVRPIGDELHLRSQVSRQVCFQSGRQDHGQRRLAALEPGIHLVGRIEIAITSSSSVLSSAVIIWRAAWL